MSDAYQTQDMPASSCFFISRPGEAQVLLSGPQGPPQLGQRWLAGQPCLTWPAPWLARHGSALKLVAWASTYMAATPATWGAAMEVPWPQV